MGQLGDQAHSLGDSVGPNEMGASNLLWQASARLHERARVLAAEYQEQNGTRRDGKREVVHLRHFHDRHPLCWNMDREGEFAGSYSDDDVTCPDCLAWINEHK